MTDKIQTYIKEWEKYKVSYWDSLNKKNVFNLFKEAYNNISGYHRFVKKNSRGNKYNLLSDIPASSKKTLIKKYQINELLPDNELEKHGHVISVTSGTSGTPTYFFRNEFVDFHHSIISEYFLQNGTNGSILYIDCFSMGVWIAGLINYQAIRLAALRGCPVTIITPGINKTEIFNAIKELGKSFDSIILAGYPPFIKDLVDESEDFGIKINQYNIRLVFAAESFTENFRDYLVKKCRISNPYKDTMNIYGSVELGAMAFETETAIFFRRELLKVPELYQKVFGDKKIPTLAQYDPRFISFEEINNQVLVSGKSAMPLIRYQIGDIGGTLSTDDLVRYFNEYGIDIRKKAKELDIKIFNLPFVYVYERADLSTTLYGLQVYPQTIRIALEEEIVKHKVTGKFAMSTKYNKENDQYLEINIELQKGIKPSATLKRVLEKTIADHLLEHNSEFRELTRMLTLKRTIPRIKLWKKSHELFFTPGRKQKWTV